MTPAQLTPASFVSYSAPARAFAIEHLVLLQRLPLAVCPSFLQQIQNLHTSFPAEQEALRWQCTALQALPAEKYKQLTAPLSTLALTPALQSMDWVNDPAAFITELTAHLWSSGQLNLFRAAATSLFAAVPPRETTTHRTVFVVLGKDATIDPRKALRKLARNGITLTALKHETAWLDIRSTLQQRATDAPYASWYIDGGPPLPELTTSLLHAIAISYPGLSPLRERVLQRMQSTITSGSGGAEAMRTNLTSTSQQDVAAADITPDPILQRFYTELFTQSSGPQIFSTSFVQWTGRELARRAQPQTLLLRYTPRQAYHDLNELVTTTTPTLDAQGAFRDAEMGAYYNWIEMDRITTKGKLTFVAWIEDHPFAVILSPNAPTATTAATPMPLSEALHNFG